MRIGIDLDGVLCDFNSSFLKLIETLTGRKKPEGFKWPPTLWGWPEKMGVNEAELAVCWRYVDAHPHWWRNLKALATDDELYNINALTPEHDVYFITSRGVAPRTKAYSEEWLEAHGIINPTVLICDGDKMKGAACYALQINLMIDDKPQNLQAINAMSPKTKLVLMHQPWNVNITVPFAGRVECVEQFLELVRGEDADSRRQTDKPKGPPRGNKAPAGPAPTGGEDNDRR